MIDLSFDLNYDLIQTIPLKQKIRSESDFQSERYLKWKLF